MAQHAILRFEKHKGNPARPLEAHHERQKEQYASNPDIDTSRSKYNFHIIKPEGRYYHFIQNRIEQAGCRTRKDSTRFVDTLITASPEFFKKKSPKEIQEFFQSVPFPVSWTVKMKKKQKETQDILSYHTQAAGCSDKARAKASGGRQPIEECGRTGL